MPKYVTGISLVLLALCLANVFIQWMSGSYIQGYFFDNADALYLPTMFSDVFAKGGHIKDWYLTPAPYFFPDFPIFLVAYLVGPNPAIQIVAYAVIQATLTFLAIWFLAQTTKNNVPIFTAAAITVALTYFALNDVAGYRFFLSSAYHYGAYLGSILLAALWIQMLREETKTKQTLFLVLAMGVAFAATLSDKIFLAQCVAPLIATELLLSVAARDYSIKKFYPLGLVTLSSLIGAASYGWIVKYPIRFNLSIGTKDMYSELAENIRLLLSTITAHPSLGFILLVYVLAIIACFLRLKNIGRVHDASTWFTIFSLLSICSTVGAVLLATNLPAVDRYQLPVQFWSVVVVGLFVSDRLRGRFVPVAVTLSLVAFVSMGRTSYRLVRTNGLKTSYYPDDISCIDNALRKHGLSNGVANYWDAKYIQNFSKLGLNIAQYNNRLVEGRWITSKKYFKPSYDFAIIDVGAEPPYNISSPLLVQLSGAPKVVETCGRREIYVYDKDKMRIRKSLNVGDSNIWKGCELPTRIGTSTDDCGMKGCELPTGELATNQQMTAECRKKDYAQPGFHGTQEWLTGPTIVEEALPAGRYYFRNLLPGYSSSTEAIFPMSQCGGVDGMFLKILRQYEH